jgi:PadR family transcriptional regulator PadR
VLEGGCRDQDRIGGPGHDAVEDGHSKEDSSKAEDDEISSKTRPRTNSPCCKPTWRLLRRQTGHDQIMLPCTPDNYPARMSNARKMRAGLDISSSSVYTYGVTEIRDPTYLAMVALASEPLHGYGIIKEVQRLSRGRSDMKAGTLYALLDRLENDGLVQVDREEVVDGRLRRYYGLTKEGTAVLADESLQRSATSREALRRLRIAGVPT